MHICDTEFCSVTLTQCFYKIACLAAGTTVWVLSYESLEGQAAAVAISAAAAACFHGKPWKSSSMPRKFMLRQALPLPRHAVACCGIFKLAS